MAVQGVLRAGWLLGLLALVLAAGCSSGDDEAPPPTLTVAELAGVWLNGCVPETDASGAVTSRLTAVAITGAGGVTFHEYHWSSDDCAENPALLAENTGSLSLPGGEVATFYGTAAKANMTATGQWITVFDPDLVGRFDTDNAYGVDVWSQGTRVNVTGLDYDGQPGGTVMQTLLLRSGETLYVGDEDTIDGSGYPTAVQPESSRVPTAVLTQAALQGEWSGPCRPDNRTEYGSQAALEWVSVQGATLRVTTTFHESVGAPEPSCDTSTWATPMVRETMVMSLGTLATVADKLTERGLATGAPLTLTSREVTPLNVAAVTALNDANDPDGTGPLPPAGGWGQTGWVLDTTKVIAPDVQFDGSAGGPTSLLASMLVRGDRFYVRGGESATDMPLDPGGYPLSVGTAPLLRNRPITTVADLAGNWFEPCVNPEGWATGSLLDVAGTPTRREIWYGGGFTCQGTPTVDNYAYTVSIVPGSLMTDRGTAYFADLTDASDGHVCALVMRLGSRLHGLDLWWPGTLGTPCSAPADFPVAVGERFLSVETTPVTAMPLSTWRGPCRQEPGVDWQEYFTFHAGAMLSTTLEYASGSGCTGPTTYQGGFHGRLVFGTTVSVAEGAATRVILVGPPEVPGDPAQTMLQVFKWMGDQLWFGDDQGPVLDGYPTTLVPGHGMRRID